MQRKQVIFIADSLDSAHKFQQVLAGFDVDVAAGSSLQFKNLLATHPSCDLVIYEAQSDALANVAMVEAALAEEGSAAMLVVVDQGLLAELRLPVQVRADFVVAGACADECAARIRQLLWPGNEASATDFITIDNMTINLATYQVTIDGEPVDLTLMEYSLLSFLATHPSRAYSREALLHRVWGFEYCGGTRTVDVHIRRVRSKVGPQVASHIVTVRGVGYLFKL